MKAETYFNLKQNIIDAGFLRDIEWSENIKICDSAVDFCFEAIFVICNSGMKAQIATGIYKNIIQAIAQENDISTVFGHKGKVLAIKDIIKNRDQYFSEYRKSENKLDYLETLPFIGKITKYHLAKNLGIDCVKPDRHLVRIAKNYGMNPFEMCKKLSKITGDTVHTIDYVIWRSANLGLA